MRVTMIFSKPWSTTDLNQHHANRIDGDEVSNEAILAIDNLICVGGIGFCQKKKLCRNLPQFMPSLTTILMKNDTS